LDHEVGIIDEVFVVVIRHLRVGDLWNYRF